MRLLNPPGLSSRRRTFPTRRLVGAGAAAWAPDMTPVAYTAALQREVALIQLGVAQHLAARI